MDAEPYSQEGNIQLREEGKIQLQFGNDMSRLVRGLAIILMVAGHTMPGHVVAFAVPLFSFLVGYGYNFSRGRDLRHSARRSWHLLSHFWFILFLICVPAAILTYPKPVSLTELGLNMFGLNGRFNFYCWYIYFYLVAMLLMPLLSRWVNRWGLKGVALICLAFGIGFFFTDQYLAGVPRKLLRTPGVVAATVCNRVCRYMPVVIAGYYMASRNLISKIRVPRHWTVVLAALSAAVGLYFFRAVPYVKMLDLIWAPVAAVLVAVVFGIMKLKWLRWLLTGFGVYSMGIWFLHALFFTHTTRKLFLPLIDWIPAGWGRVVPILLLSWVMAIIVDKAFGYLKSGIECVSAWVHEPPRPLKGERGHHLICRDVPLARDGVRKITGPMRKPKRKPMRNHDPKVTSIQTGDAFITVSGAITL